MAEIPPSREAVQAAIRRHFKTATPAEPGVPPPGPDVQRENPFAGFFRGATSMLGNGLEKLRKALPSDEANGRLANQFQQRASQAQTFGHSLLEMITHPVATGKAVGKGITEHKTELAAGALASYAIKEAAKTAASAFLPGGILVRVGVGALGGAAAAAAKETISGVRSYSKYKEGLDAKLKSALSAETTNQAPKVRAEFLRREYTSLQEQIAAETDSRKKEALADHLRYLGYFIRKQDWEGANRAATPQEALNEFLAYSRDNLDPTRTSLSSLKQEILRSERVDKTRLKKRIMRGAAFGAVGGILGGLLVDWISSNLEAAPAPMPAAGAAPAAAAETATPAPAPTETPTPKPTATPEPPKPTATVEPPKPSPTAVPAEATPAAPGRPALAPDAQAAAPAPAPEPPPAPPAPQVEPLPAVAAPEQAAPATQAPAATARVESLPPTTAPTGVEVQGSAIDNTLTYGGKEWVIVDNGVKNIGNLFQAVGESGDIDKQALASSLQKATDLWTQGQLSPGTDPDLYKIFHLSNGTASLYNNLLQSDTLESLKKLGIVIKK